jgi:dethiobiotin synthetase
VLVLGTGTEVGKTWVSARLLATLRQSGVTVAARKPAQSFDPDDDPMSLDSAVLGAATGEPSETVCRPHRSYPTAMAPPMAAEWLGRPGFTVAGLVAELVWPSPRVDVGVVESAGGVRSPQADDGDAVTLVRELSPDMLLLVADAGLGTINSVRLSLDALPTDVPRLVVLNRFDGDCELHRRNRAWLGDRDGFPVLAMPVDELALASSVRVGSRLHDRNLSADDKGI